MTPSESPNPRLDALRRAERGTTTDEWVGNSYGDVRTTFHPDRFLENLRAEGWDVVPLGTRSEPIPNLDALGVSVRPRNLRMTLTDLKACFEELNWSTTDRMGPGRLRATMATRSGGAPDRMRVAVIAVDEGSGEIDAYGLGLDNRVGAYPFPITEETVGGLALACAYALDDEEGEKDPA